MTQHREDKTATELRFARAVGRLVGALSVEPRDRDDPPDATIVLPEGATVGLEIVTAVGQAQAGIRHDFERNIWPRIRKELRERNLPTSVELIVDVDSLVAHRAEESADAKRSLQIWRKELPSRIADLVEWGGNSMASADLVARGVRHVSEFTVQRPSISGIGYNFAVPRPGTSPVGQALLRKACKLPAYKERNPHMCEFWLAIGPHGIWEGFQLLESRRYGTPFDRVFSVHDLKPFCDDAVANDVTPFRDGQV